MQKYNGGIEVIFTGTHDQKLFAGIYIPPEVGMKVILDAFQKVVEESRNYRVTSILGDFNMDMQQDEERSMPLISFLHKSGFEQQVTGPTLDSKRVIDQIWVRNSADFTLKSGATESYYSDHKAIWLSIRS
jgi:endonuclease/exonuclease/phosphatase family metal-dependent hydrolase